ncbi:heme ABC exporter ATP-binding protein CcmA [Marinomonas pollencensis]|uniref:Heme exporter protein A n=1 Tax=Marinomonas pollencensis TaxID=491954 RepID=A0A3E0DME5_9GAMM|nr:heme ABC exporter ATP-binding protein CcmA [Marinomonas pollencensis]REG82960.1 heme exporter protein A [Marinomonas pollencensis]
MYSVASLTISDFLVERGESDLLNGLSFSARSGEIVHISGANGAGKSTFFKALLGLLPLLNGTISLNGEVLVRPAQSLLSKSLYIGHGVGLNAALTVMENLSWYFPECHISRFQLVLKELSMSAFAEAQLQQLSAGQLRRVALARLWLSDKPIWLLDEPFTALDQTLISQLEAKMADHISAGGIIILASHLPLKSLPFQRVEL